jgi:hypothetical protein
VDPRTESPAATGEPGRVAGPARARAWVARVSWRSLLGPLCLALLVCGFLWKLTLTSQYTWIDNPDITRMDVPRLQFQRATWHNGEFPLWDPHQWCGQPFLGEIVGAAFPLNWPFLWFPFGAVGHFPLAALNWYFVFLHLIGALAAYWLCRELKLGLTASILGGLVYTFGGFVGVTLWPEVLSSLVIAPLVFVFLVRALRGARELTSAALSGMFLGLAWLSGHHEVPIYLTLTAAATWLYGFVWRRPDWRRWFVLACVSFAIAALTSGFQTIPGYEYAKLATRWVGANDTVTWNEAIPYRVDAQYSLPPSSIVNLAVPSAIAHDGVFTGAVALALALIAVFRLWRERWIRLFACIALGAFLLALGNWNPFHGLLYALLPLFGKARTPLRLLSMVQLGVTVLAAAGFESLQTLPATALRGAARALLIGGAGIFVLGIAAAQLHQPEAPEYICLSGLAAVGFGCLMLAWQRGSISKRLFPVALLALVLIELGGGGARLLYDREPGARTTYLPELTRFHDAANFLKGQPGPVRVYTAEVTDTFNLGDWDGIDTLTGFGAGVTSNIAGLDWASVRGQNLLGVGYTLSKSSVPRADQTLVFRSSGGFNVFKNNDALPRTWIVHQAEEAASLNALRRRLNDVAFDPRRTALLEGTLPALQPCSDPEEARISDRSANSVLIDARLACRGMLILSDTWYPGWSARVDGTAVAIYKADSALRGIVLDPGTHHIEFHYRPASAVRGAIMSLLGLLGVFAIAYAERRGLLTTADRFTGTTILGSGWRRRLPVTWRPDRMLLVVCALAAVPGIYLALTQFVEYDGFWHVFIAQQDNWQNFWFDYRQNDHPPLMFLLLKAVLHLGRSVFLYRSIPLACDLVSIYLVGKISQKISISKFTPVLTALAFGLSIGTLDISISVRSYMLSVMFVLLAFYYLLDLLPGSAPERLARARVLFAASLTLAVSSHYMTFFYVAACGLILAGVSLLNGSSLPRKAWVATGVAFVPAAGAMCFYYLTHIRFHTVRVEDYLLPYLYDGKESKAAFVLRNLQNAYNFMAPLPIAGHKTFLLAASVFALIGIALLIFVRSRAVLPLVMLLVLLGELAFAALHDKYPFGGLLRQQYMIFPFAILSAGVAVDRLFILIRNSRLRAALAAAAAVAILAVSIYRFDKFPKFSQELFTAEMNRFDAAMPEARAVLLDQFNLIAFFIHHHQWKWRFDRALPTATPVDEYTIEREDVPITVLRDKYRWTFDFSDPAFFHDVRENMRAAHLSSLAVFCAQHYPGTLTPDQQDAREQKAFQLAEAEHLQIRKFVPDGTNVYAEFEMPAPQANPAESATIR